MPINAHKWICGNHHGHFLQGSDTLTDTDLHTLGVPADAQLAVLDLHYRFCNKKPNTYTSYKYTHWPQLDVLQVETFVEFYASLSVDLLCFNILLIPFNGIQLQFVEYGLCIPGLGYSLYKQHTQALWSILAPLLPTTRHEVKAHVTLTRTNQDGYTLLWLLGSTIIKVWTRMRSVPEPRWLIDNTVFSWAQRIQLYDILRRLCGQSLDKKDISLKFLQGVRGKHMSLAQAMLYQLDKLAVDDDTISSEWTVDTMSLTLNSTVTGDLVDEMQLRPRFQRNRPAGPRNRPPAPGPRVHFLSTDPDTADDDKEDDFYSSTASATSQSSINNTSLQRSNTQHQQRGPPNGSSNQQRRPPRHDGNCRACGRYGHKETHCDHLAIWANLQRYLKMATPATLQQAEAEWMEKNKRFLGGSTLTPSKVAANFIAAHNGDINHIFTTLDWDTWSEDTGFTLLDDSE